MSKVIQKARSKKRGITALAAKQVSFSIVFTGGVGDARVRVKQSRNTLHTFNYSQSGSDTVTLNSGMYRILLDGMCTSEVEFVISEQTNPKTPESFSEGPIDSSYTLEIA